jgi:cobalt/nickel transport system permease protein
MTEPGRALPLWLEANPPVEGLRAEGRRSRRRGFVRKSLRGFAEALQDQVFSERLAREAGLLQRVDARLKLVTTLLLIGTAALLRHASLLVLLNLWVLWLAAGSRVPLGTFLKRVWVFVPLFTLVVVLPATLNIVRPGTPLLVLFHLARPVRLWLWTIPQEVAVTRQGAASALLLVLRVGASVSLAVLLTLTTRWAVLLKALRVLRVPAVFISVLEMTYRYVFLLLQVSADMFTARRSRTVGRMGAAEGRRFASGAMGSLWARSHATSEEVHRAMLSRGYTGEPRALAPLRFGRGDALWGLIVLMVIALLMGGNRVLG